MDVEREREFFDEFESAHHDYDVLTERAYRRLLREFERRVRPRRGERCVDLGCGSGAFTRYLGAFDLQVTGMDLSPRLVARAQARSTDETYLVGDIRATGLAAGAFDIVAFSGVLHHLPERTERFAALSEARRLLRGGGRVFTFDPSAHSPSMWLYRDPRSPFCSTAGRTPNEILIDRDDLASTMRAAGLRDVTVTGVSDIGYRYVEGAIARRFLHVYNVYEAILSMTPLEAALGTFLVGTART